ncbi:hypothetical protein FB45DRAFT_30651 [Roridomyces roridus]|uniref:Uncharacterized protein n=1 Tax=Roridomyces roridus TaxID=1738132 RepID=A0AAD7CKH4_9AGAR|nr:hypothetical protein FB45DRAFT_30651 [Roridomyces roridus]
MDQRFLSTSRTQHMGGSLPMFPIGSSSCRPDPPSCTTLKIPRSEVTVISSLSLQNRGSLQCSPSGVIAPATNRNPVSLPFPTPVFQNGVTNGIQTSVSSVSLAGDNQQDGITCRVVLAGDSSAAQTPVAQMSKCTQPSTLHVGATLRGLFVWPS